MKTFRDLLGFGFMPQIVFDSGGDSSSSSSDSGSSSSSSSTPAATTAVPTFDTYYDAIDAGYGGQEVSIGGQNVIAATADGYTGSGSGVDTSFADSVLADTSSYMPPSTTGSSGYTSADAIAAASSYDDDNDYNAFQDTYAAQSAAADVDPYGASTGSGFVTSGGMGVDVVSGGVEGVDPLYVGYDPTGDTGVGLSVYGLSPEQVASQTAGVTSQDFADYIDPVVSVGTGTSGLDASDPLDPFGGAGPDIVVDPATGQEVAVQSGVGSLENALAYSQSLLNNELDTQTSGYENEAYGGSIEDYYNPPPSDDGGTSYPDTPPPSVVPTEPPAPPPVYYDAFGNEYGSQAEATAADDYAAAQEAQAAEEARLEQERLDQQAVDVVTQPQTRSLGFTPDLEVYTPDVDPYAPYSSAAEANQAAQLDAFYDDTIAGQQAGVPGGSMPVAPDDVPITYVGDQAAGVSGGIDSGRYDFVDDLPDDALDFVTDVGATDDDLATDFSLIDVDPLGLGSDITLESGASIEPEAGTDDFQAYLDSLVDRDFTEPEQTGLESVESGLEALPDNLQKTRLLPTSDFELSEIEADAQAFMDSFEGKSEEELLEDQELLYSAGSQEADDMADAVERASRDMNALDILSEPEVDIEEDIAQLFAGGMDDTADIEAGMMPTEEVTVNEVQNPTSTTLSPEMQEKLAESYADMGRYPGSVNAAEARLIQDVLNNSNIRMDEDRIERIVDTMRENGATDEQIATFREENPEGTRLYGGDGSFGSNLKNVADDVLNYVIKAMTYNLIDPQKMSASTAQKFLDAYKETGKFVYDSENPDVVIGVEDSDGNLVRGFGQFENTEDGPVRVDQFADMFTEEDDSTADPCPEGMYLDPVTNTCMPIESVADTPSLTLGPADRPSTGGGDVTTPVEPDPVAPIRIRSPKQFAAGGAVTPNIDRFLVSMRG